MPTPETRRDHLRQRVSYWSERLQVEPKVVRVQRMIRKWGSCSTSGILTLAEDLADQDIGFQDYVIAHEVLHLRYPRHGRVFAAVMSAHLPGWRRYQEREARTLGVVLEDSAAGTTWKRV